MPNSVTVIIPAYNEEQSIGAVLDEIKSVLTNAGLNIPVIVVDDGSTDNTGGIAKSKGVTVIQHVENRGYGASLKTGIHRASSEFVIIMDADKTYPAQAIHQMIQYSDMYDMVVGARGWKPSMRAFAKWCLVKLSNYLAETKIPDLNSGLRLIRKSIVERFWPILPNGFSFTTTITLAMICNGYAVKYIPIEYRARSGVSKIQPVRSTWQFLVLILRTMVYFNPLRVFIPVGLFMIFGGVFIGFYTKFVLGQLFRVTTTITVTSGVQILMLGFLADLIVKRTK